jgi:hypothetical protein
LPCISLRKRAKGTAGTFQRGKLSESVYHPETYFSSQQLHCELSAQTTAKKNSQRTASLDELAEPNNYSKRMQTSSTRVFASQEMWVDRIRFEEERTGIAVVSFLRRLLNPSPDSKLQVFQSIERARPA